MSDRNHRTTTKKSETSLENPLVKRLMWRGLAAVLGVLAAIASQRVAEAIWVRVFDEPPPDD